MSPRPRKAANKDLPPNLYERKGRYYYRRPTDGVEVYLGGDRAEAKRAAKQANIHFSTDAGLAAKAIGIASHTVAKAIERWQAEDVAHRQLKAGTLDNIGYRAERVAADLGRRMIDTLTTKDVAEWLDGMDGDAYKTHRSTLSQVCDFAITKGWMNANPVTPTKPRKPGTVKQRERLTLDGFKAIYALVEPWMQIAMDLALVTLQRRGDVVRMRFADETAGNLLVEQEKTGAALEVAIGDELRAIIKRARMSGMVSPYIVHRRQQRKAKGNEHRTQVTPEMVSRAFADARDALPEFADMQPAQRPTFHEVRALGGRLYEKAGWSKKEIQALMGHADEEMTEHYLEGHAGRRTITRTR